MKSRKIVLMNLFSGHQWRHRHRNKVVNTVGEREGGTVEREAWKLTQDRM